MATNSLLKSIKKSKNKQYVKNDKRKCENGQAILSTYAILNGLRRKGAQPHFISRAHSNLIHWRVMIIKNRTYGARGFGFFMGNISTLSRASFRPVYVAHTISQDTRNRVSKIIFIERIKMETLYALTMQSRHQVRDKRNSQKLSCAKVII